MIPLEVVSDVVCPWCFIGKRRLEKALALLGRSDTPVVWKAFQLNPGAPKEGLDRAAYRARKFGSLAYAKQLESRVAEAGSGEGIDFRFDRIERVPNTFDAHRLIWLAGGDGSQNAVVEKLFRAYFLEGQDVGAPETLRRIALESGLTKAAVDELFTTELGAAEVRTEERHAREHGVSGVPSFFVNHHPVLSGAQNPELLAAVLAPIIGSEAAQCSAEVGTCG